MANSRYQCGSIFTGLLLIFFGLLFLARRYFPGLEIGHFLLRYWPLILILWGAVRLLEYSFARRSGRASPAAVRGGEIVAILALLVLVAGVGSWDALRRHSFQAGIPSSWMHESATSSEELPLVALKPGAQIRIDTPNGDITIHTGDSKTLRVVAKKTAYAWSQRDAESGLSGIQINMTQQTGGYDIQPAMGALGGDQARVDLDVQVPPQVNLSVQTSRGDVDISGITGTVAVSTDNGDVDLHGLTGDAQVQSRKGDTHVTGDQGNVHLTGQGSEVEIADVTGDVTIDGEFYGPIRLRNIGKTARFTSSRTDLTVAQLSGHLELDSGDIEVSDTKGALKLTTREKDVTLENIAGRIEVDNRNGDIDIRCAQPPRSDIVLSNNSGDITLTLPPSSSFSIHVSNRSGDIESDFQAPGLNLTNGDQASQLDGSIGSGRPQIQVQTTYGTFALRKAL